MRRAYLMCIHTNAIKDVHKCLAYIIFWASQISYAQDYFSYSCLFWAKQTVTYQLLTGAHLGTLASPEYDIAWHGCVQEVSRSLGGWGSMRRYSEWHAHSPSKEPGCARILRTCAHWYLLITCAYIHSYIKPSTMCTYVGHLFFFLGNNRCS